jgi:hypothetical protein
MLQTYWFAKTVYECKYILDTFLEFGDPPYTWSRLPTGGFRDYASVYTRFEFQWGWKLEEYYSALNIEAAGFPETLVEF